MYELCENEKRMIFSTLQSCKLKLKKFSEETKNKNKKKNNELDKTNKTKKNLFFLLQFLFSFYLNVINLLLFFFNFYFSRLQNDKKEKKSLFFLRTLYKIWFLSLSSSFFFLPVFCHIFIKFIKHQFSNKKKKRQKDLL